jgi:hypothetical protein
MPHRSALSNKILASIPGGDCQRLSRQLEPVSLRFGQVLYEPGRAIRYVYFPVNCLVSLLTSVDRHRTLEVGMVGNEGMAGMPFILGVGISGVRALVQGAGQALRMASTPFRAEFERTAALQQALYRYAYALMAQISQTAACNRFHDAGERLARWLLMTRDRVGADDAGIPGAHARAAARRRYRGGQRAQATQPDCLHARAIEHLGRAGAQARVLFLLPGCECRVRARSTCKVIADRARCAAPE